jgi:DNA-binding NarL/FixJ family response regulator
MKESQTHGVERPTIVAAVVPDWLQAALAVLLQAEPDLKLVACTANVQTLLLLALEESPDLVLLDANGHDSRATDQVRRIKAAWPKARLVVLVKDSRQGASVEEAGADATLLKGASAKRLVSAIHQTLQSGEEDVP